MKKILTTLRVSFRRHWRRLQAADLYVELDRYAWRKRLRQRYHRAAGSGILVYARQTVSAAERRWQRQIRFWLPFAIVVTALLLYPVAPLLRYSLSSAQAELPTEENAQAALTDYEASLDALMGDSSARLPVADDRQAADFTARLVIEKIGVDTVIVEGSNAHQALDQGVWRMPVGSTPDQGGNTILTAHRYKFLPPSSKTFYLLDKLEAGDAITVQWQGKRFSYRVRKTQVVTPQTIEILRNTKQPQLTLFTCTPLFSSKNRLVVIADLIEVQ